MDMTMRDHNETKISEQEIAVVDSIELGNNDWKLKSCSSTVENEGLDACQLTPKNCGAPTDLETSLPKCEREGDISRLKDNGSSGDNASEGNAEREEERNLNMRSRRKSKYLSPPFVEPKGELSKKSGDKSTKDSGKPSLAKRGRKRKQPMEPIAVSAKLEEIQASSAELLLQLKTLAATPYCNKAFNPAELFCNRFRASVFRGVPIEEQLRIDKTFAQKKVRALKQKKTPSSDLCDGNSNIASSSPLKRKVEQSANLESDKNQTTQNLDLNCFSKLPGAAIDPLPVTGQGEAKSAPEKKKRIIKKKIPQPISVEAGIKDAFSASTVPNSNVASPPGFCAKGLTPPTPISVEVSVKDAGSCTISASTVPNSNVASPPGFLAKGLTPHKPIPTPTPISVEVSIKDAGSCARSASTVLNSNVASPPGFSANGLTPHKPNPTPTSISVEARIKDAGSWPRSASTVPNSNVASPPGFWAKGLTPHKPAPAPTPTIAPKLEPNTGSKSSPGLTLEQMKQSLEFMTSVLEKSGDRISPVIRANLEKEIKDLLKKVDPMISSSSS